MFDYVDKYMYADSSAAPYVEKEVTFRSRNTTMHGTVLMLKGKGKVIFLFLLCRLCLFFYSSYPILAIVLRSSSVSSEENLLSLPTKNESSQPDTSLALDINS